MDNSEGATRVLRDGVRQFEDDKSLRLSFARLLIQNDEFKEAQEQFEIIVEQDPEDWETLYSVALLDMELENFDSAINNLEKLILADQRFDESQYYLGFIYEQLEEMEKSIKHYREVRIGTNNFLAAQQQATRHAINLGQLYADKAIQLPTSIRNTLYHYRIKFVNSVGLYYRSKNAARQFSKPIS